MKRKIVGMRENLNNSSAKYLDIYRLIANLKNGEHANLVEEAKEETLF